MFREKLQVNEKALLIGLSYFIGFNAAFIAFGLPTIESSYPIGAEEIVIDDRISTSISTYTNDIGLFAMINGRERIISAKQSLEENVDQQGFHVDILSVAISPNEEFIYYCELPFAVDSLCRHMIYDVSTDVIHPVVLDKKPIYVGAPDPSTAWKDNGLLNIAGYSSVSDDKPWIIK